MGSAGEGLPTVRAPGPGPDRPDASSHRVVAAVTHPRAVRESVRSTVPAPGAGAGGSDSDAPGGLWRGGRRRRWQEGRSPPGAPSAGSARPPRRQQSANGARDDRPEGRGPHAPGWRRRPRRLVVVGVAPHGRGPAPRSRRPPRRRAGAVREHRYRCRRGASEHTVEHERGEMDGEIPGRSEALHDGDGTALAGAHSLTFGGTTQPAEHDADEHRQHIPAPRGVEGELRAQRPAGPPGAEPHGAGRDRGRRRRLGDRARLRAAPPAHRVSATPSCDLGSDRDAPAPDGSAPATGACQAPRPRRLPEGTTSRPRRLRRRRHGSRPGL